MTLLFAKIARSLVIWLVLAVFAANVAWAQGDQPTCVPDLTTIVVPITGKTRTELPVRSLEMTFKNYTRVMSDGSIQPYVQPETRFRVGVNLANATHSFCSEAQKEVEQASLTFTGCSLDAPSVSPTRLTFNGSIGVQKWWSMTGFCCHWFSCHRCEWKTKIFDRTVSAYANFDRNVTKEALTAGTGSTAVKATGKTDINFVTTGGTHDGETVVEQIWDFLGGFISWLGHIFGKDWKVKFSDVLGQQLNSSSSPSIDPMNFLVSDQRSYGFSSGMVRTLNTAAYKQRGVWDAFNSSLSFSESASIFETAGGTSFLISFPLDYEMFLKTLEDIYEESPTPIVVTDPLYTPNFCAVGRDEAVKFLNNVAQSLQDAPETNFVATVPKGDAYFAIEQHFGIGGVEEYLISAKRLTVGKTDTLINSPPLKEIIGNPATMPAGGSIDAVAFEQGWSREETACSKRIALRRWGTELHVRPFESFEGCLSADPVSKSQRDLLIKVLTSEAGKEIPEINGVGSPIGGQAAYRGWFSCRNHPHICGPSDEIAWWQEPSKFGHVLSRNFGVDVIDWGAADGTTKAVAIADGPIFPGNDRSWGNAILQPFKTDGRTFVGVYAHLSKSSISPGAIVNRGDQIGLGACNDDPLGRCETTCSVNGRARLEQHVHFELIEFDPATSRQPFRKLDPATVLKFPILDEQQRFLYPCQRPNSISLRVSWPSDQLKALQFRQDSMIVPNVDPIELEFIDPQADNKIEKVLLDPHYFAKDRSGGDFRIRTSAASPTTSQRFSAISVCHWDARKALASCTEKGSRGKYWIRLEDRTRNIGTAELSIVVPQSGFRVGSTEPDANGKISSIDLTLRREVRAQLKF